MLHGYFAEIARLLARGGLTACLPETSYSLTRASAALRHLSQAQHVGKVLLHTEPAAQVRGGAQGLTRLCTGQVQQWVVVVEQSTSNLSCAGNFSASKLPRPPFQRSSTRAARWCRVGWVRWVS